MKPRGSLRTGVVRGEPGVGVPLKATPPSFSCPAFFVAWRISVAGWWWFGVFFYFIVVSNSKPSVPYVSYGASVAVS